MRLIDIDRLTKPIYAENDGIDKVWEEIVNAPIIEAMPVIHAHWCGDMCSNCHHLVVNDGYDLDILYDYCPYCGARIDK